MIIEQANLVTGVLLLLLGVQIYAAGRLTDDDMTWGYRVLFGILVSAFGIPIFIFLVFYEYGIKKILNQFSLQDWWTLKFTKKLDNLDSIQLSNLNTMYTAWSKSDKKTMARYFKLKRLEKIAKRNNYTWKSENEKV